jgi:alkylhydroperoxidase family enzyme
MSNLRLIDVGEATGDLKRGHEAAVRRAGKVFDPVKAMCLRPAVLRRSMDLYKEIMFPVRALPGERELLAVVVSRANDCHY